MVSDEKESHPLAAKVVQLEWQNMQLKAKYQALFAQAEKLAATLESIRKYSDDMSWTAEQALAAYRAWRKGEGGTRE